MAQATKLALSQARGQTSATPDTVPPEFPYALRTGKFIKSALSPFPRLDAERQPGPSAAPVSPGLRPQPLQGGFTARSGLESCSVIDSFLGGLSPTITVPDSEHFQLNPAADSRKVYTFATVVCQGLKHVANALSKLHANSVLAKRDSFLSRSPIIKAYASECTWTIG